MPSQDFCIQLATTTMELMESQALRYQHFFVGTRHHRGKNLFQLDQDSFDIWCDHILLRERRTSQLIGACRILSPSTAKKMGRYYSETEFDLSELVNIRDTLIEVDRICIHHAYRNGSAVRILVKAICRFAILKGFRYISCCGSVALSDRGCDPDVLFKKYHRPNIVAKMYSVQPLNPFRPTHPPQEHLTKIPPVIRFLMAIGAQVCGPPSHDPYLECADLFMLLDIENAKVSRKWLTGDTSAQT